MQIPIPNITVKNVSSFNDLPLNVACWIDESKTGINQVYRETDGVWIQSHRRMGYDKIPRFIPNQEFSQWREHLTKI